MGVKMDVVKKCSKGGIFAIFTMLSLPVVIIISMLILGSIEAFYQNSFVSQECFIQDINVEKFFKDENIFFNVKWNVELKNYINATIIELIKGSEKLEYAVGFYSLNNTRICHQKPLDISTLCWEIQQIYSLEACFIIAGLFFVLFVFFLFAIIFTIQRMICIDKQ
jgi:hypothetical protein